jgi:hypothetical protein
MIANKINKKIKKYIWLPMVSLSPLTNETSASVKIT